MHDLLPLELIVVLAGAMVASGVLARRLRVPPPLLLLLSGALLGFVPALRQVQLPPAAMLLIFLPALLFWESLTTSLREIRSNLRPIVLLSTVLVVVTAGAVAVVGHALGLPWGPAWVLGAALAPTDATAVGVLARALPRRMVTMLRAESLVNDGTALVVYGLAVGITVGEEHLSPAHVSWLFLLSYGAGIAAGAVAAWLGMHVRRRLDDPLQENVALLATPFLAFLLAEFAHASGVLAVVVCGLIVSQVVAAGGSGRRPPADRGVLVPGDLRAQRVAVRPGRPRGAVRRPRPDQRRPGARAGRRRRRLGGGDRHALRLAVHHALPDPRAGPAAAAAGPAGRRPPPRRRRRGGVPRRRLPRPGAGRATDLVVGGPLPGRDLIVFVTAGVIVVTLAQGLLLPGVVRWARLPHDTTVDEERHLAETLATEGALAVIPQLAAELGVDPSVAERLRGEYDEHLGVVRADGDGADEAAPALRQDQQYTALRLAVLAHKRATVVGLRDEGRIDDTVLRQVQTRLDIEEVRLSRRELVE